MFILTLEFLPLGASKAFFLLLLFRGAILGRFFVDLIKVFEANFASLWF